MPIGGGTPTRLAADARIFVPALPAPRVRWSPDGTAISFLVWPTAVRRCSRCRRRRRGAIVTAAPEA